MESHHASIMAALFCPMLENLFHNSATSTTSLAASGYSIPQPQPHSLYVFPHFPHTLTIHFYSPTQLSNPSLWLHNTPSSSPPPTPPYFPPSQPISPLTYQICIASPSPLTYHSSRPPTHLFNPLHKPKKIPTIKIVDMSGPSSRDEMETKLKFATKVRYGFIIGKELITNTQYTIPFPPHSSPTSILPNETHPSRPATSPPPLQPEPPVNLLPIFLLYYDNTGEPRGAEPTVQASGPFVAIGGVLGHPKLQTHRRRVRLSAPASPLHQCFNDPSSAADVAPPNPQDTPSPHRILGTSLLRGSYRRNCPSPIHSDSQASVAILPP
ncbi:hypothetical protein Salat_2499200 [Sesamum alatum]|uniref:Uncharacterized protein n=1 Tax=Sesamum alatum TaxID=300844 RepID=A0AAE1XRK1_9LAMI|nr:hypothetical protein Salat_2499200 [Sesamum alatum]